MLYEEASRFLFRHFDKPERFEALMRLRSVLSPSDFYRLFGDIWINSESLYMHQDAIREALTNPPAAHIYMMEPEEREMYDRVPEITTIYRGCWADNQESWSYTLNEQRATWFARRCPYDGQPLLVTAQVKRTDIIAFFTRRGEEEVVVDPDDIQITDVKRLGKVRLNTAQMILQQVQSGTFSHTKGMERDFRLMNALSNLGLEQSLSALQERLDLYVQHGFPEKADEVRQEMDIIKGIEDGTYENAVTLMYQETKKK